MKTLLWKWRYGMAAKRNAGRIVCFSCFLPLVLPPSDEAYRTHVLQIDRSTRLSILCSACHWHLETTDIKKKVWFYRQWFKYFSGWPADGWERVEKALEAESGTIF